MTLKQNHAARAELNRQNRLASGPLSDRFPEVAGIVIRMTYYQRGGSVLMVRTINICPPDPAYFNMECMIRDCVDGGFDLTAAVTDMVKGRKKARKGSLACCGKTDTSPSDHAHVSYEIGIQYGFR